MTAKTIRFQVNNRSDSYFPGNVSRDQLANFLGYDPDGETVAAALAALDEGREVDVYGEDGVSYLLWPVREDGTYATEIGRRFRKGKSPVDYTVTSVSK